MSGGSFFRDSGAFITSYLVPTSDRLRLPGCANRLILKRVETLDQAVGKRSPRLCGKRQHLLRE